MIKKRLSILAVIVALVLTFGYQQSLFSQIVSGLELEGDSPQVVSIGDLVDELSLKDSTMDDKTRNLIRKLAEQRTTYMDFLATIINGKMDRRTAEVFLKAISEEKLLGLGDVPILKEVGRRLGESIAEGLIEGFSSTPGDKTMLPPGVTVPVGCGSKVNTTVFHAITEEERVGFSKKDDSWAQKKAKDWGDRDKNKKEAEDILVAKANAWCSTFDCDLTKCKENCNKGAMEVSAWARQKEHWYGLVWLKKHVLYSMRVDYICFAKNKE